MVKNVKITTIDRTLAELGFYSNPKILKKEFSEKINFEEINVKEINKYHKILINIKWALEKVLRYPTYFSKFYPSTEVIPEHEALEHNIHAYIEDLNILRNKIHVFLGTLRNDLKKIAINKNEVNEALKFLTDEIFKVFENVSSTRNPHNHGCTRFKDDDIIDVEFAIMALDNNFPLKKQLRPEFIEELKKKEVDSFEKAKKKWIDRSEKNSEQTSELVEEILSKNKDFLYQLLNIKPLDF